MQQIFYNGTIITMEDENTTVEAILIENERIKSAGDFNDIKQSANSDAEYIDLCGKTLMPAFIDAHSHFSAAANSLLQVPLEETSNFDEIMKKIEEFINNNNLKAGEWIIAKGYDNNSLEEKAHPHKKLLDTITKDYPMIIQHKSGHSGIFNSKALEILGVNKDTKAVEGGVIELKDGELTGYMEENSFFDYLKQVPLPDATKLLQAYVKIQEKYASNGITTIQEGMMVSEIIPLYEYLFKNQLVKLDVVGYIDLKDKDTILKKLSNHVKTYHDNFKIGGYKIFLDGSPQVRTAWMLKPYKDAEDNYSGYGTMTQEAVEDAVELAAQTNMQIIAHCNGDAASKQYVDAIKEVYAKNKNITNLRPVIIHAQLLPIDQLDDVKEYHIIPSFFVAHVYHWGDTHIKNFGLERASKISLANSALQKDILFTFHQDTPVIEPNMLETIWCAVNRRTKNGVVLGVDESIPVIEALKAVTINAAYQYFEEDEKGSIKPNKYADFVILDKNPLTVPKDSIKDIIVLETIKKGKIIYKKA